MTAPAAFSHMRRTDCVPFLELRLRRCVYRHCSWTKNFAGSAMLQDVAMDREPTYSNTTSYAVQVNWGPTETAGIHDQGRQNPFSGGESSAAHDGERTG